MPHPEFRALLHRLVEASAAVIRPYFASPGLDVELKSDSSPVTRADREAEAVMREIIQRACPDHGIIGEEYGREREDAEFVWTLDPIDGTVSFTCGCALFGTLIGLLHEGRPVLGAIHQPIVEMLCVGDGRETTLNGRPVRLREVPSLDRAVLLATDLANIERYRNFAAFETLRRQARVFRTWGDCYGYLMLAAGWGDVMLDPIMNPWDVMPVIPVIRGAGGMITAWDGSDPESGEGAVAAHPSLHGRVIEILNPPA